MQQKRWFSGIISRITVGWAKYLSEDCLHKLPTPQKAAESPTPYTAANPKELGGVKLLEINRMVLGGEPYCQLIFEVGGRELNYWLPDIALFESAKEIENRCFRLHDRWNKAAEISHLSKEFKDAIRVNGLAQFTSNDNGEIIGITINYPLDKRSSIFFPYSILDAAL